MEKEFIKHLFQIGFTGDLNKIRKRKGTLMEFFKGLIPRNIATVPYPIYESDDAYFHFDRDFVLILEK